ncbi:MAG: hypothetical protein ABFD96_09335, partial [Armatimonadia bacterium]
MQWQAPKLNLQLPHLSESILTTICVASPEALQGLSVVTGPLNASAVTVKDSREGIRFPFEGLISGKDSLADKGFGLMLKGHLRLLYDLAKVP